jgi:DnaJ-class molecular chaperone
MNLVDINYLINYYAVLDCENTETNTTVFKKSYYKLSKIYHPDNIDTGNKELFEMINTAYKILMDEKLKSKYDKKSVHGLNYEEELSIELNTEVFNLKYQKIEDMKIMEALHIVHYIDYNSFDKDTDFVYKRSIRCTKCNGKGIDLSIDYNEHEISECCFCMGSKPKCEFCGGLGKVGYESCTKCNGKKVKIINCSIKPFEFLKPNGITEIKLMGSISKDNMGVFGNLYLIDENLDKENDELLKLLQDLQKIN